MWSQIINISNKKFWEELIAYFHWYDKDHTQKEASNNSSVVACVFVTAVTFLPSRCLAAIGGFLPSRCLATIGIFLPSRCLATIRGFLPSRRLATIREPLPSHFVATIGGYTDTHTQRQQCDLISLLDFFKIRKVGWKLCIDFLFLTVTNMVRVGNVDLLSGTFYLVRSVLMEIMHGNGPQNCIKTEQIYGNCVLN
jgi:hypothetical protein